MTKHQDAAIDRFIRCVSAADVWSDDVTQAYDALGAAFGVDLQPPTKTYTAARQFAAELVKARTAWAAAVKQADVEFLAEVECIK